MSNKNYKDTIVRDDSIETAEDKQQETVIGVVTDCLKLNIRKEPCKDSEVAAIVNCLDELSIDTEASVDGWYAVCTATGIEGFCMKEFVAVRK